MRVNFFMSHVMLKTKIPKLKKQQWVKYIQKGKSTSKNITTLIKSDDKNKKDIKIFNIFKKDIFIKKTQTINDREHDYFIFNPESIPTQITEILEECNTQQIDTLILPIFPLIKLLHFDNFAEIICGFFCIEAIDKWTNDYFQNSSLKKEYPKNIKLIQYKNSDSKYNGESHWKRILDFWYEIKYTGASITLDSNHHETHYSLTIEAVKNYLKEYTPIDNFFMYKKLNDNTKI